MDISKVGENIDAIRKMRGWSKAELARRTGYSQQLIGRHILDNGKCMRLETAVKYAEALGCTLDDLTGDAIDPMAFTLRADITAYYPYNLVVQAEWYDFKGNVTDEMRLNTAYSIYVPGLFQVISDFSKREQQVLGLRYEHDLSLDDVAKEFHVTRERIRQIEHKAFRKIRSLGRRELWDVEYIKDEAARNARVEWILNSKPADTGTSIDILDLSTRTYNCIRRTGIKTVEELSTMTFDDLIKIRNLGRHSIEELLIKARDHGITFHWKEEIEEELKGEANDQN